MKYTELEYIAYQIYLYERNDEYLPKLLFYQFMIISTSYYFDKAKKVLRLKKLEKLNYIKN